MQVAAEVNGNDLSEFIYATRINIPELVKKSGRTYRVITDHLGSPVLVINTADGTIESQAQYNEWGRVIEETNAGFIPFGFAGGLRDLDTGLVRFGARDYNPNTAKWISKDPIGFNGEDPNLYRYVGNDPVNLIDPYGEIAIEDAGTCIILKWLDPEAVCGEARDNVDAIICATAPPIFRPKECEEKDKEEDGGDVSSCSSFQQWNK